MSDRPCPILRVLPDCAGETLEGIGRALEGHWRAFFEGIGGALVGIGGHWWILVGIGGPPQRILPQSGRGAQNAFYLARAKVLKPRATL